MTKDERIAELESEVDEKDKELTELIAELKDRLEYITRNSNGLVQVFDITDHDKKIRHEICEKIRERANEISFWECEYDCRMIEKDEFDETLNKIEQGE